MCLDKVCICLPGCSLPLPLCLLAPQCSCNRHQDTIACCRRSAQGTCLLSCLLSCLLLIGPSCWHCDVPAIGIKHCEASLYQTWWKGTGCMPPSTPLFLQQNNRYQLRWNLVHYTLHANCLASSHEELQQGLMSWLVLVGKALPFGNTLRQAHAFKRYSVCLQDFDK